MHGHRQEHRRRSGHRSVPHTADLIIEAWAPTPEECVAEAVRGVVGSFAEIPAGAATAVRECFVVADREQLLLAVLEEVVYRLEAAGELPVETVVTPTGDGGALVRFTMVDAAVAEQIGAVPKAVSRHGLRLAPGPRGWVGAVTVDV